MHSQTCIHGYYFSFESNAVSLMVQSKTLMSFFFSFSLNTPSFHTSLNTLHSILHGLITTLPHHHGELLTLLIHVSFFLFEEVIILCSLQIASSFLLVSLAYSGSFVSVIRSRKQLPQTILVEIFDSGILIYSLLCFLSRLPVLFSFFH